MKEYNHYSLYLLDLINENNYKKFVEIGIWQCSTLRRILRYNKSLEEYWGIDNFNHIESEYHRKLTPEVWDGAYFQACRYMVYNPILKVLRMTSLNASKLFQKKSLDMVFIDGNHTYEYVKEDMECWEPLIRKGGIISGHDYLNPTYGVKQAVDERYGEKVKELPGGCWYIKL